MVKKKLKNLDFSKIGGNISSLMNACGIDAIELSRQTGLPGSTISRLRSNNCDFSPNLSSLLPIADYFCISLSQLIGEEPINHDAYAVFKPSKIRKLPIPILTPDLITDYLLTKNSARLTFLTIDFPVSTNAFAYLLKGNAMEPQFPDKTLLIIDPEVKMENLDHILVIPTGKKLPIFRQVLIEGEEIYIRTLNPAFNEFIKLNSNSCQLLGVMVQSRMNYKDLQPQLFRGMGEKQKAS